MTLVRPVHLRLVTAQWAPRVVGPLHDVLTESEHRTVLAANPDSYLHVTSDLLARPDGRVAAPGDAATDTAQARALRRLLDQGAYRSLPEPGVFVYRMRDGRDEHTGVVASVDVAGFTDGRVLGHERVQPARVHSLLRHYERVTMRSELVALFHRAEPRIADVTAQVCGEPALLEFTDSGGIEQCVWRAGPAESTALIQELSRHRHYVADGHHRVAAALHSWEHAGRPRDRSVLCALYPHDHVSLHAFHRRVRGPVATAELLEALGRQFDVRGAAEPPVGRGAIGLYAAGGWWLLNPRERPESPGVAGLDVTLLEDRVLRPLLGIQADDPRLEFIPDLQGLEVMVRACDGDGGVLFTLHAPRIDDLIAAADRHEVMSAKTTYVRPKPRTGVFLS